MKYKIIGLATAAAVVLISLLASALSTKDAARRIHQHRESRRPEAGCSCSGTQLCTHLPLLIVNTGGLPVPGEPILDENRQEIGFTTADTGDSMLAVDVRVIDNASSNNHPDDSPALASSALIRIRGNSSRYFEKKSYLLRLTDEDGSYADQSVMGMDPHYEWALHGPYLDKSLIRNYMWYNIAGEIMEYAPNVRFCELILDGAYQGLYLVTETITSGKNSRLNLTEPLDGLDVTGFAVRLDRGSGVPIKNIETFTQYTYRNYQDLDIKFPRTGSLTPELVQSVAQEISDFEKALYSYDYDTDNYGYWHNIDTNSFVDYFIINEFTANYDAGWLSTYLYKDVGGKFKTVIWDFNSSCDNYTHSVTTPQHIELQHNIWYFMLMKDEFFNKKILRRYEELRESYLSEEYLDQYIDETISYLGGAVDRNFEVWGGSLEKDLLQPPERNPRNNRAAVEQMKDYIHTRGEWLDENIIIILQYSHESKNKKFNH